MTTLAHTGPYSNVTRARGRMCVYVPCSPRRSTARGDRFEHEKEQESNEDSNTGRDKRTEILMEWLSWRTHPLDSLFFFRSQNTIFRIKCNCDHKVTFAVEFAKPLVRMQRSKSNVGGVGVVWAACVKSKSGQEVRSDMAWAGCRLRESSVETVANMMLKTWCFLKDVLERILLAHTHCLQVGYIHRFLSHLLL